MKPDHKNNADSPVVQALKELSGSQNSDEGIRISLNCDSETTARRFERLEKVRKIAHGYLVT